MHWWMEQRSWTLGVVDHENRAPSWTHNLGLPSLMTLLRSYETEYCRIRET